MTQPKPGDRVRWIYNEPDSTPEELHGKVIGMDIVYKVHWDDGTEEIVDARDVELDRGDE